MQPIPNHIERKTTEYATIDDIQHTPNEQNPQHVTYDSHVAVQIPIARTEYARGSQLINLQHEERTNRENRAVRYQLVLFHAIFIILYIGALSIDYHPDIFSGFVISYLIIDLMHVVLYAYNAISIYITRLYLIHCIVSIIGLILVNNVRDTNLIKIAINLRGLVNVVIAFALCVVGCLTSAD